MSQKSRPVSDVSNATWSPVPLYPQLNEAVPNDSTYVTSSGSDDQDVFVVGLANVLWPLPGPQVLIVRLESLGGSGSGYGCDGGPVRVRVELLQNGRPVPGVATVVTPDFSFGPVTISLPPFPNLLITYDDDLWARNLQARITTQPPPLTPCCPNRLPGVLYCTFSSPCECFNYTRQITYSRGNMRWESETAPEVCPGSSDLTVFGMECTLDGGNYKWVFAKLTSAQCAIERTFASSVSCCPFIAVFDCTVSISAPCLCSVGTPVRVTITQ